MLWMEEESGQEMLKSKVLSSGERAQERALSKQFIVRIGVGRQGLLPIEAYLSLTESFFCCNFIEAGSVCVTG